MINRWETRGGTDNNTYYINFERERNTYVDTNPSSVTTQSAIDFNPTTFAVRFNQSKVDLDGHGRPIRKTLYALGAAAADQMTTFTYNNDGTLGAVAAPDPTANTAATVTYTYGFDSLGRPTSLRRPDTTNPATQSGTNIVYNGLAVTTAEVVGAAYQWLDGNPFASASVGISSSRTAVGMPHRARVSAIARSDPRRTSTAYGAFAVAGATIRCSHGM